MGRCIVFCSWRSVFIYPSQIRAHSWALGFSISFCSLSFLLLTGIGSKMVVSMCVCLLCVCVCMSLCICVPLCVCAYVCIYVCEHRSWWTWLHVPTHNTLLHDTLHISVGIHYCPDWHTKGKLYGSCFGLALLKECWPIICKFCKFFSADISYSLLLFVTTLTSGLANALLCNSFLYCKGLLNNDQRSLKCGSKVCRVIDRNITHVTFTLWVIVEITSWRGMGNPALCY